MQALQEKRVSSKVNYSVLQGLFSQPGDKTDGATSGGSSVGGISSTGTMGMLGGASGHGAASPLAILPGGGPRASPGPPQMEAPAGYTAGAGLISTSSAPARIPKAKGIDVAALNRRRHQKSQKRQAAAARPAAIPEADAEDG